MPGSSTPASPATASTATGSTATGSTATGSTATRSTATGSTATGSPAPSGHSRSSSTTTPATADAARVEAGADAEPGAGLAQRRRVRDRLARRLVSSSRTPTVKPVLEPLLAIHRGAHPKVDARLLQRGYDVAERCHRGQLRKSGDPYITHPLAVATILAELGMDTTTLVAALLHDTVEDTGLTTAEIEAEFGPEVAHLVEGVTKLDKVKFGEAAEAETIRKMVIAMARDPRVLVIKLADRLHNMRTLRFLPPAKQERKARETLEVLAPLAHRLGMNTVKWELEDLAFA
ncbi:MAG: HD domain-containing protein, partial [Actinobacteria bacterium]|nr:HD domain-containing protein [Actinomycetota bacterium]